MTVANDLIFLSLRNAGVNGIGQTPMPEDVQDSFVVLNALIGELNLERKVKANPIVLPTFSDLTSDVPFWTPYTHFLLTAMAVRLRQVYGLPPNELDVKLAADAMAALQAINQQQAAPIHGGKTATVLQVIFLALRMAGRLTDQQSVADTSKDVDDAFQLLINMLAQWRRSQFLAWVNAEAIIPSTGAQSYPMLDRPARLSSAFARLLVGQLQGSIYNAGPLDFPLAIIDSQSDYNDISLKSLTTFPAAVWYKPDYPTGTLWFWPIPPKNQFELHVFYASPLPDYATTSDTLGLPPEYTAALVANLAVELVQLDAKMPPPSLINRAAGTLAAVRASNAKLRESSMPGSLIPQRGGQGGISGAVGPHQSVIVLDSANAVLG